MIDIQYNYESVENVEGVEGEMCVIFQMLLSIFLWKYKFLKSNIYIIFVVDNTFIMSHIVFYIKLEPYLKQWLHNSLGNPVVFPPQSNENAVIRRFLRKWQLMI